MERNGCRWSDPSLYALGFVVGLVPIVAAFVRGGAWGAEPTVGAIFCVFFGGALVVHAVARSKRRRRPSDGKQKPSRPDDPHDWSLT